MNRALSGRLQRAAYRGGGSARMRRFARLVRRLSRLRNPLRKTATEIAPIEASFRSRRAMGPPPDVNAAELSLFILALAAPHRRKRT